MKPSSTTVIFPLGSPPPLYTAIAGYRRDYIEFNIAVVHTGAEPPSDIKNNVEQLYGQEHEIKWYHTGSADVLTREQNQEFFELVMSIIAGEKNKGRRVMMCIAGGRKTMSALMLTAANLTNITEIHHVLLPPELEGKWPKVDQNKIIMVPNPVLHIGELLEHIVSEIDEEGQFGGSVFRLIDKLKTEETFHMVNDYLNEQARARKLKEEYRVRRDGYLKMAEVTAMIVKNLLQGRLMYTPVIHERVKDFSSFLKKLKRKEEEEGKAHEPFSRIRDLAGIRIIFYNKTDLETAREILQGSDDFTNADPELGLAPIAEDRSRDYGYRAFHLDIKLRPGKRSSLPEYADLEDFVCEIQLTTVFAHSWSQVHHKIVYKSDERVRDDIGQEERMEEFRQEALKLEAVEQSIDALCKKYFF